MNKQPLISIIIPIYNIMDCLEKCVDSCINQTYQNIQIIVSDDCSSDKTRKILKEYESRLVGGVLHCFNASPILLELSSKFYYGIGGVLTFKNGKKLVEILPKIPLDRLVLETDAPYLTPEPHRGKRNEPAFTTYVADKMADILGLSRSDVESITTQNANRLFGI